jgi:2,4-dienoyl-CoA reductase-like NADH-dependent reductase (Old Yellow Enzyme family)
MSPGGNVTPELIAHHQRLAKGGVGLTTVAYCSVSSDGRTFAHQLWMREAVRSGLAALTRAVHDAGSAVSLQLGHAGYFANRAVTGCRPIAPGRAFNTYSLTWSRAMTPADLDRVRNDFATAARWAQQAGFDAIELHAGHGYLLSQFLSPFTNHRRDAFGGDPESRLRYPLDVLRSVREAVGSNYPVIVKTNLRDGFPGGLDLDTGVDIATRFASAGAAALFLSGGFVSRTPFYMLRGPLPVQQMAAAQPGALKRMGVRLFGRFFVEEYPMRELFFLDDARRVRAATDIPLILVGGIRSRANIEQALAAGFDFVALGRPLIFDPDLPLRLQHGEIEETACTYCNECVAEMDRGGVRCTDPRARR